MWNKSSNFSVSCNNSILSCIYIYSNKNRLFLVSDKILLNNAFSLMLIPVDISPVFIENNWCPSVSLSVSSKKGELARIAYWKCGLIKPQLGTLHSHLIPLISVAGICISIHMVDEFDPKLTFSSCYFWETSRNKR